MVSFSRVAVLVCATAAWGSAGAIDDWKAEIERLGHQIVEVPVEHDRARNELRIPQNLPRRAEIVGYLEQEALVRRLMAADAVTLHHGLRTTSPVHFVLLNLWRENEWRGGREGLLAHELGHVWLSARGYATIELTGREIDCVLSQAADALQHVLIRDEVARRGIDFNAYWTKALDLALDALERGGTDGGSAPCDTATRAVLLLDVELGALNWSGRDDFLRLMRERYPDAASRAGKLREIATSDLSEIPLYLQALKRAFAILNSR